MSVSTAAVGPDQPLLQLSGVRKVFPTGTPALRGVDLVVRGGTVHGLLGANGAGKSTLIKIVSGALSATAGSVAWQGQRVQWKRPWQARKAGVATLYQHIPLVGTLSVLENVFLGDTAGWRRTAGLRARLQAQLNSIGYQIDVESLVGDLSIGQRQMVAILQALAADSRLIVMDEPTASLAAEERAIVYRTVRHLSREGRGVLFVSHFLDEVMTLTDEVTVLRDGIAVLHAATADLDEAKIAEAIVGRALTGVACESRTVTGVPLLEVKQLESPGKLAPCSFDLRVGEVLGVAGFLGAGRSELLHAIFGADREARGQVTLQGSRVGRSPLHAVRAGLALVPEDRMRQGLFPGFSLWQNTTLPFAASVARGGILLDRPREIRRAQQAIERLHIKAAGVDTPVSDLSGGNAQKVCIARWLFGDAKVFLLDEPTAGVDIGARHEILAGLRDLAARGAGVIMVSSDFEELLAVSDRILVLRDGAIVAQRPVTDTNEQELILLAGGTVAQGSSSDDTADTLPATRMSVTRRRAAPLERMAWPES
jgi:ribose transport system ATP-binding protein